MWVTEVRVKSMYGKANENTLGLYSYSLIGENC